jgi:hypothetical protein
MMLYAPICLQIQSKKKPCSTLQGFLITEVVPIIGVELMTYRLQGGCSTN